MLYSLISTDGASSVIDLINILREDLKSGPAKVPQWYHYSDIAIGPTKKGYDVCCNRGCYKTETVEKKVMYCSGCE